MSDDSYVFEGPSEAAAPRDNNPPLSISELSFALKRTLEERFGHVRLRGEVSKVNRHASGHIYLTLKDDKSAIDGVIWKGSVRGLGVRPFGATRAAEGPAARRGPVRAGAQEAPAPVSPHHRRHHQPDGRRDPRRPAPDRRTLALPGDRLARGGPGRGGVRPGVERHSRLRRDDRRWADPPPRPADRGPWGRLGRGPVALLRRG